LNSDTQAHLQFAQANAQTKNCKRACFPTRLKIVFSLSKKIKNTGNRKNKNIALNDGEPTTSGLPKVAIIASF